jgi:hypothetical protein
MCTFNRVRKTQVLYQLRMTLMFLIHVIKWLWYKTRVLYLVGYVCVLALSHEND